MFILLLSQFFICVLSLQCSERVFSILLQAFLIVFCLFKEHFFFTCFFILVLQVFQLLLFLKEFLVSFVVLLSKSFQSGTDFFLLFSTCFPLRNEVIWLEQCVSLHMRYFSLLLFALRNCIISLEFLPNSLNISRSASWFTREVVGLWST